MYERKKKNVFVQLTYKYSQFKLVKHINDHTRGIRNSIDKLNKAKLYFSSK